MAAKVARKRRGMKKDVVNPAVLDMAVEALRKDPGIGSRELMERATAIDPSLKRADGRVFHMRYAMRARRMLKAEERAANPGAARTRGKRRGRKASVTTAPVSRTRRAVTRTSSNGEMTRSIVQSILMETMTDALNATTRDDVAQLLRSNEERAERIINAVSGR